MNYQELRAALDANEHQHALRAVSRIRYRMLEGQLARAVEARKAAERKLHEHVCDEHDEINRLRAENRRLLSENEALRRALLLDGPVNRPAEPQETQNQPRPYQTAKNKKRPPTASGSRLRNSELVQRALRGEPFPEPPEPGTFDPTITEEDLRDYGS